MTAAGWYPDPENEGYDRWWDGTAWSDFRQPSGTPAPAVPAPAEPGGMDDRTKWALAALGAVVLVAVVVAAVLLLGGDDDDEPVVASPPTTDAVSTTTSEATTTTEEPTTTTEAPTTTTTGAPTTTTTQATTTTVPPSSPFGPQPTFSNTGASGSGCTPGGGSLPDGWWYGYGMSAMEPGSAFDFDLACFFVGDAAQDEAADRGDEAGDVYITNDNPQLRTVQLAADASMRCVTFGGGGVGDEPCPPGTVPREFGIWVRVDGGRATRVLEQYLP
jgi:hypothetical protein